MVRLMSVSGWDEWITEGGGRKAREERPEALNFNGTWKRVEARAGKGPKRKGRYAEAEYKKEYKRAGTFT